MGKIFLKKGENMSSIPNVRERYIDPLFPNTKGGEELTDAENPYWEGNLNESNATFVKGFDFLAKYLDTLVGNAFETIEYELESDGMDTTMMQVPRIELRLKEMLKEHVETMRNESITSMLEMQDCSGEN